MTYTIVELKAGEKGGFAPRGALKRLWQSRDFSTIVSGPAETGKTWGCLQYLDALLWKYPNSQGVMASAEYSTLIGTCLPTYRRIIGPNSPIKPFGGEHPQWFDYPNGARLWLAGLDKPGKALSSERSWIYVNQAERIRLETWETLTTRCTGRGTDTPYTRIFGDCNPDTPYHWIKQRESAASLLLLESQHTDNPTLYDDAGVLTEQGKRTMAVLDALTGVRRLRLRDGRWVSAEGVVYEGFSAAIHVIDPIPIPDHWPRYRAIDFGYVNPFVCLWVALDDDGRMHVYREVYHTKRLVSDHADQINALSRGERFQTNVGDHDAEDRATLDARGIYVIPAPKMVEAGIQAVAARLRVQPDGKPRLFIHRGCTVEHDGELQAKHHPTCLASEFESYSWPKGKDDKPVKEAPIKMYDHALDAIRMLTLHLDGAPSVWVADPDATPPVAKGRPMVTLDPYDEDADGWTDLI